MASITKLNDADLLINDAIEGYVITAEDWITAMKAIRDTVNGNTDALSSNIGLPYTVTIKEAGDSSSLKWTYDATMRRYRCFLQKKDINKTGTPQAHFYNTQGTEINCNYQDDATNDRIIVTSCVNAPVTVIIR